MVDPEQQRKALLPAGIDASEAPSIREAGAVADEGAGTDRLTVSINCWDAMPRRQCNKLVARLEKEWVLAPRRGARKGCARACDGTSATNARIRQRARTRQVPPSRGASGRASCVDDPRLA